MASDSGSGDAYYNVCPANWRMPTGGSSGEYQALYSQYNTTQDATNADSLQHNLSTPLSGRFYGTTQYYLDTYYVSWSSTHYNSDASRMYNLNVRSNSVIPQDDSSRINGFSIRCLAK